MAKKFNVNNKELKEDMIMQYDNVDSIGTETLGVGGKTYQYGSLPNGAPINYGVPMNMVGAELPQVAAGTLYHYDTIPGGAMLALTLNLNVTELLQVQAQNMFAAYNLGAQTTSLAQQGSGDTITVDGYLGVYDKEAYGVYDSLERYNKSETYWNRGSRSTQKFIHYDEAVEFAKAGVSSLSGVPITAIPPLRVPCNWRQKIVEKSDEN